jgi:hypothetical protein
MTAVVPEAPSMVASSRHAQRRLEELSRDTRAGAGWWVEVTRQLDSLAEAVRTVPGDMVDLRGFTEQIRSDAPHLMGRWVRVASEQDDLYYAVTEVRMLASSCAGDPGAVQAVSRAIRGVLARLQRFQERTTDVMLDAYERDMGGE